VDEKTQGSGKERGEMKGLVVAVSLLFLFLAGCAYEVETPLPPGVSSIAIPLFSNQTFEWGVEETLTRLVIEEFQLRTRLSLEEKDKADLLLEGEITHYLNELSTETAIEAEEYRLTMEVVMRLISLPEEKILWSRKIREATSYSVSSEIREVGIQTEEEALIETSRKIAQHLANLTLEGWER
jgi:hypothetical protein